MILRKLEYLIALAKEGHFARAAAACHVSQPTLSAGIQQLELELGVMIVKRGQRFQGFTPEGEIVLAWAQRIAVERQRLHQELRDRSGQLAGTLRIGVIGSTTPISSYLTIPFGECHPKVSLSIEAFVAAEIQQGLEEFSLDVGVTYLDEKLRRQTRTQTLYAEEYQLLIKRGTELSGRTSVSWEEVRGLPLCLFTPESQILGTAESELLWGKQDRLPHVATRSILVVMDYVRTGKWGSVVPRPIHPMIVNDTELEAIPLPNTGETPCMGIVIPHREPASPLAEAFFEIATSPEILRRLEDCLRPAGVAQT